MIAVAIVGILSAIAFPSYIEHVKTARRGIAQAELLSFSNAMEQYYIQNSSSYLDGNSAPEVYPSVVKIDGVNIYNLTISVSNASSYTITAAPITGTTQAGDGSLTLTNTGARTWGLLTHW